MISWSNRYIGTPYAEFGATAAGCNCWGLAVLVFGQDLGIRLPTYHGLYTSIEEQREIAALVEDERSRPVWNRVELPGAYDLAVFRRGQLETHIGIVASPGVMLHIKAEDQAKLERFTDGPWKHRLTGFYRHADLTS